MAALLVLTAVFIEQKLSKNAVLVTLRRTRLEVAIRLHHRSNCSSARCVPEALSSKSLLLIPHVHQNRFRTGTRRSSSRFEIDCCAIKSARVDAGSGALSASVIPSQAQPAGATAPSLSTKPAEAAAQIASASAPACAAVTAQMVTGPAQAPAAGTPTPPAAAAAAPGATPSPGSVASQAAAAAAYSAYNYNAYAYAQPYGYGYSQPYGYGYQQPGMEQYYGYQQQYSGYPGMTLMCGCNRDPALLWSCLNDASSYTACRKVWQG